MYDIIVRCPDAETAKEFTSQMCDGWGEGFCNFSPFQKGSNKIEIVTSSAPEGTPVFFLNEVFEL